MNIFVGNLSFEAKDSDIKSLFEGFGAVASAVIVMRKEKKAPKSRGFAFVDMPDDAQALAAIDGLNGKEFMGRMLNVNPARSKAPLPQRSKPQEDAQTEAAVETAERPVKAWRRPVFNKPGTFRGGRRTVSYMKRRGVSGMQDEFKPRKRSEDNPMRWRKKKDQAKPWAKPTGDAKPWKKSAGDAKPWSRSYGRPQKPGFKRSKKPGGYKR